MQVKVTVGLKPEERAQIENRLANSTCRSLSEYVRKVALEEPVIFFYRSKSFDEYVVEAIILRKELQELRKMAPWDKSNEERLLLLLEQIKENTNKLADCVLENRI